MIPATACNPLHTWQGLYAIVDDQVHENFGVTTLLLHLVQHSTIPVVQLRCKTASPQKKQDWIRFAVDLKQKRSYTLIINDDVSALEIAGVDGVHLGFTDADFAWARRKYPKKILGLSTHSLDEALRAASLSADYIGCGSLFPTKSKTNTQSLALHELKNICQNVAIPKVGIGGITLTNMHSVIAAGSNMVAVLSGLVDKKKFVGQNLHQHALNSSTL